MKKITFALLLFVTFANAQDAVIPAAPPQFLVNFNYGPSFRIGKISPDVTAEEKKYIKDLKSGAAFDISAYYMKDQNSGFGLKYSSYNSSAQLYNMEVDDPTAGIGTADPSDDITISFIGVSAIIAGEGFMSTDNVSFEVALGYIGYKDDLKLIREYEIRGENLGLSTTLAYHFGITKYIMVGPAISFTGGVLRKMNFTGNGYSQTIRLEDDALENLYRFDLSIGARFRLQ